MKSIVVIQEVQILPWVMASHQPGSETRWQEETNVRSRVERVGRPCMEPRNRVYVVVQNARPRTGKGINNAPTNPTIGIKTEMKNIRLVIKTPLTISFTISLTVEMRG